MKMFQEENGKVSSTRVTMFICVINACVITTALLITKADPKPWTGVISWFLCAGFGVKTLKEAISLVGQPKGVKASE